jgi:hypothetical protein
MLLLYMLNNEVLNITRQVSNVYLMLGHRLSLFFNFLEIGLRLVLEI